METSPSIAQLIAALAKAKAAFRPLVKDRTVKVATATGGSYTFDYATASAIGAAVDAALHAHGLVLLQAVGGVGGELTVSTTLAHDSGEWIRETVAVPRPVKAQELGSLVTYLRRYQKSAMLDVVADDDDDANAADGNKAEITRQAPAVGPPPKIQGDKLWTAAWEKLAAKRVGIAKLGAFDPLTGGDLVALLGASGAYAWGEKVEAIITRELGVEELAEVPRSLMPQLRWIFESFEPAPEPAAKKK